MIRFDLLRVLTSKKHFYHAIEAKWSLKPPDHTFNGFFFAKQWASEKYFRNWLRNGKNGKTGHSRMSACPLFTIPSNKILQEKQCCILQLTERSIELQGLGPSQNRIKKQLSKISNEKTKC